MTREDLRCVSAVAERFLENEKLRPAIEPTDPDRDGEELELDLDGAGIGKSRTYSLMSRILESSQRTSTSHFFNQLFGGRDEISVAADMLVPLLNVSMYTLKMGGPHVLIEREVIRKMRACLGWDGYEGTLAPGGSLSNLGAMIIARNVAMPGSREAGLDGRRLIVYDSQEAHYSVPKAAGMTGIGRDNVRAIATDDLGRMRPDLLREAITDDLDAGNIPCMINATAGTTVLGAFDPIDEIADIAEEFDIWFHIDGAYGGSVIVSDTHRDLLKGAHRADSFTWDAHKLLGVPLLASALLIREEGLLRAHFDEMAEYLFQSGSDEYNLGRASMQCGRRNDALKVWALWKCHGDAELSRRIDRLFQLSAHARACIEAHPRLSLTSEPMSTNICFEVEGRSSSRICELLDEQGRIKIGTGRVNGRRIIRLVCVNPDMTESDIDHFFEEVLSVADSLDPADNAIIEEAAV